MSGWYPDPAGRYELRFHNGEVWTADVSTGGQRFVDRLPIEAPRRQGNGVAVAAMVCGIASVVTGWVPFVVVIGLAAAIVAIVLGIVGLRRSALAAAPDPASPSPGSSPAQSACWRPSWGSCSALS